MLLKAGICETTYSHRTDQRVFWDYSVVRTAFGFGHSLQDGEVEAAVGESWVGVIAGWDDRMFVVGRSMIKLWLWLWLPVWLWSILLGKVRRSGNASLVPSQGKVRFAWGTI